MEEKIKDVERKVEQLENEKYRKSIMYEDERKNLEHKHDSKVIEIDDLKLRYNEREKEFDIFKKKKDDEISELHDLNLKHRNEKMELKSDLVKMKE